MKSHESQYSKLDKDRDFLPVASNGKYFSAWQITMKKLIKKKVSTIWASDFNVKIMFELKKKKAFWGNEETLKLSWHI